MKLARRRVLGLAGAAVASRALVRHAAAQTYPAKPIRWIVGFAPGGSTDILARLMGQWLAERLGQPVLIENRPGAGSNIATEMVVNAAPDGYTLLMIAPANAVNATLYEKLSYNFIRDIAPVCRHQPRSQRHGGEQSLSGEIGGRIHRLCQGQSGPRQHGLVRQRHLGPCGRRAVQDDGRHHHDARALSRRRARPSPISSAGRCR